MSTRSELAGGRLSRGVKEVCAAAPRARVDGSPTPPATRNSVVLPPPRPPSPPGPRPRRGPGRGAQGPFANQKNRRAQNDLGRRPSTPQKRGAVDQGHSAATERTQALDDEPRRPARTRCSAARRSFKGQFDSQHRRRYRASRVLEPRPAPPPRSAARERLVTRAPAPRRRRASREGRRRRPSRPRGRRLKHTAAPPRAHHAFAEHREALRRHGDGREQPQERGARRLDRLHLPGGRAPRPSGSERSSSRPSCSSCTVTPTSSSLPRVSFPLSPLSS